MRRVETILARVLRAGVGVAAGVMAAGLALMLARSGQGTGPDWTAPASLGAVAAGLRQGDPLAVMALGLLLLTVTPVLRVIAAALTFVRQRDWPLALASLLVLALLAAGMALGRAGAAP
ncbi:MAG: DUF1634 domain-containing protein [Firmicutes bacterium]|nr:DUF1634 domain-containing protein [Bacillota bacterium]